MSFINTNVIYMDTGGGVIDANHHDLPSVPEDIVFTAQGNFISHADGKAITTHNHFHEFPPFPMVKYWHYGNTEFKSKLICLEGGEIYLTKYRNEDVWAYILQGYDISITKCYSKTHAKIINKMLRQIAHFDRDIVKVVNTQCY